ncbi:MAG: transglycosylase [Proteobacteria bacterium]|nr:transglycosylase [Pseudomonadota bacterium]
MHKKRYPFLTYGVGVVLAVVTLFYGCSKIFVSADLPPDRLVSLYSSSSMILVNRPYSDFLKGDDLSRKSLKRAVKKSLRYLNRIPASQTFYYGKLKYSAREIIASMGLFRRLLENFDDYGQLVLELEKDFYVFESIANQDSRVLLTGYYEPIFEGSLVPTSDYIIPVYSLPDNHNVLKLGNFRDSLKDRTIIYRFRNNKILPFYTRQEIMEKRVLAGKNLEIAWMRSPVDLFFLQVQGSGILVLPSGERIRLSYAGANGQTYSSIGKMLVDKGKITLEEASMESIRRYIKEHPDEKERILYYNQSYTFFKRDNSGEGPRGNINVPLTPNRSIATDSILFPKAGLGYIASEMPVFDEDWNSNGTKPFARFVVIQDTGGAIKGPGRVDLFWGNGKLAEKSAGSMRNYGELYFFVAKKEVIQRFTSNSP